MVSIKTLKLLEKSYKESTSSLILILQTVFNKRPSSDLNIPIELFNYKYMLHPVRLAILQLLSETPFITSSELKQQLDIPWGYLSNHLKTLKDKNLIMTESRFIEGSVKMVVYLEPGGDKEFHSLLETLDSFLLRQINESTD